jgi:hypothetical protein
MMAETHRSDTDKIMVWRSFSASEMVGGDLLAVVVHLAFSVDLIVVITTPRAQASR